MPDFLPTIRSSPQVPFRSLYDGQVAAQCGVSHNPEVRGSFLQWAPVADVNSGSSSSTWYVIRKEKEESQDDGTILVWPKERTGEQANEGFLELQPCSPKANNEAPFLLHQLSRVWRGDITVD